MGTFWGNDGDILKVKFNQPIALGNEPATDEIYVLKFDTKYWGDTHYPEYADGIYGHPMNEGYTVWDMLEFLGKDGTPSNMNSKGYIPVESN